MARDCTNIAFLPLHTTEKNSNNIIGDEDEQHF